MLEKPRIAIIGAGLSGLTLANRLRAHAQVTIFEKSRGLGGRMSTRRASDYAFDHGAQYFTAKGAAFRAFLNPWIETGDVALWDDAIATFGDGNDMPPAQTFPRYVAQPAMNSLCKVLAAGIDVQNAVEISAIRSPEGRWDLQTKADDLHRGFDWVLSTAPAPQTRRLMPPDFSGTSALGETRMSGCYSLMLGYSGIKKPEWTAARVSSHPLAWMAVNAQKPGRSGGLSIICQTSNLWAEANLERDQEEVRQELLEDFRSLTGIGAAPAYISLHRWRFANVEKTRINGCLFDPAQKLGAAGDWCAGGRVEAAFDSASALAQKVLAEIHARSN